MNKMKKILLPECKHIIKDNYYCEKCGVLCYNKVIYNFYNYIFIQFLL